MYRYSIHELREIGNIVKRVLRFFAPAVATFGVIAVLKFIFGTKIIENWILWAGIVSGVVLWALCSYLIFFHIGFIREDLVRYRRVQVAEEEYHHEQSCTQGPCDCAEIDFAAEFKPKQEEAWLHIAQSRSLSWAAIALGIVTLQAIAADEKIRELRARFS